MAKKVKKEHELKNRAPPPHRLCLSLSASTSLCCVYKACVYVVWCSACCVFGLLEEGVPAKEHSAWAEMRAKTGKGQDIEEIGSQALGGGRGGGGRRGLQDEAALLPQDAPCSRPPAPLFLSTVREGRSRGLARYTHGAFFISNGLRKAPAGEMHHRKI